MECDLPSRQKLQPRGNRSEALAGPEPRRRQPGPEKIKEATMSSTDIKQS
jgi:hypothetical protein